MRLASKGLKVTLVATKSSMQLQDSSIQIEHISDCFEEGGQKTDSHDAMFDHFRIAVLRGFPEIIEKQKSLGYPVKLVVYDSVMPWVLDTAHLLGLCGAAFFTQSCAVCAIYYHEHQGLVVNQFSNCEKADWRLFNTFDKLEREMATPIGLLGISWEIKLFNKYPKGPEKMERQEVATSSKTHVLVFPFQAQGHMNPMIQFSKRLASKGLKVTLVVTKKSLQSQDSSIKVEHIADFLEDGNEIIDSVDSFVERYRVAVSRGLRELIEKQNSLGCPVKIVVYDSSMPWILDIAHQLGLYGAVFSTQSCAVGAVYYHMHKGSLKNIGPAEGSTVSLPSMPLMETKDLSSFIYDEASYPSMLRLVLNQFSTFEKADWRLWNTFDELEGESCAVSAIYYHMTHGSLEIGSLEGENVVLPSMPLMGGLAVVQLFDELECEVVNWMASQWPIKTVGPTIPSMYLDKRLEDDKDYGLSLFKPDDENCIKWLDTKEAGSVVYVSFGSLANLGEDQMEELACGLKQSNRYFLWVVRASEENEKGMIRREEIEMCLREVMEGERGNELKRNAVRWKEFAKEAADEGGSSDKHTDEFISELVCR
ncbi:hypothetical protein RJ639_015013 [Escallonia herrerae]|uniref:Uncharacterized protein n=1 Tax=Escallonia herrerae TaxID=1293975 RepID=A0AA88VFY3_9ASTE|nr:hypothetical protein RJ639_015013 [Escallonia herrerae]